MNAKSQNNEDRFSIKVHRPSYSLIFLAISLNAVFGYISIFRPDVLLKIYYAWFDSAFVYNWFYNGNHNMEFYSFMIYYIGGLIMILGSYLLLLAWTSRTASSLLRDMRVLPESIHIRWRLLIPSSLAVALAVFISLMTILVLHGDINHGEQISVMIFSTVALPCCLALIITNRCMIGGRQTRQQGILLSISWFAVFLGGYVVWIGLAIAFLTPFVFIAYMAILKLNLLLPK